MHDDRHPAPAARSAAPPRRLQGLLLAAALSCLAACGGGGGPLGPQQPIIPPAQVLDGLSGTVSLSNFDLGRIVEQEPNDTADQSFALAPVWRGSIFEVAGELSASPAHYGRTDLFDVFRFVAVEDQQVDLTVTFTGIDPVSANPNEVGVTVRRTGDGNDLALAVPAAQPVALAFDATAGDSYDVFIEIATGHAAYVARFVLSDPVASPKPRLRRAPAPAETPAMSAAAGAVDVLTPAPGEPACASTHLLVRLREGCDAQAFCARRGLQLGRRLATGSYCMAFETTDGKSGRHEAVARSRDLAGDPDVRWAEPDWIVRPLGVPSDKEFNRQWNMRAIGAPSAWDITVGDPSIVVGVVDSGIIDHPDMAGQTVAGYDFISDPAIAVDGDGRDGDPTDPGDGFDGSGLSTWHGTHVAGIIAARGNDGYGVTGLASGCRVLPARALGVGGGLVSDASDALLWLAALHTTGDGRRLPAPVPIANLSLGLAQDSADLRDACNRAANQGVFIVAAAGNSGGAVLYPARYASVFAVAAVDGDLTTTQYSNFGSEVDVSAPGGLLTMDQWADGWMDGVLSCVQDETVKPFRMSHQYLVGTSQASPHVAGAAALLLSLDPSLTAADLRSILRATALDLGDPGDDVAYGAGLLRVDRAVKNVLNRMGTPRSDAPYLMLPTTSIQFDGFRNHMTLPLYNGGGGQLQLFIARPETDDGAPWLVPTLQMSGAINPPVNFDELFVLVDRSQVPTTPGRYSGSVRIDSNTTTLGSIRVVLYVQDRTRVGMNFPVVAHERDTGIARRKGFAIPERTYRYFLRGLPASNYLLQGGEDLDSNGFFCEAFEACGWHGGPTQSDAIPVEFVPGSEPVRGLSIQLVPPP